MIIHKILNNNVVITLLVPFFVLLIALPIGFLVIGPIVSMLTDLLSAGFTALMSFSPALYGLILGFFWQVLVIFGLHWSVVPLAIMQVTQEGSSQVLTGSFAASFAQTAVVLAMFFNFWCNRASNLWNHFTKKMAIYLFNDWWRCRWFIFDDQQ